MKPRKETSSFRLFSRDVKIPRRRRSPVVMGLLLLIGTVFGLLALLIPHSLDLAKLTYYQLVHIIKNESVTSGPPRVRSSTTGPLRVDPQNPRYLTDASGRAIFLAGSNYWNIFQDGGRTNPPPAFDFNAFVSFAVAHGYNYIKPHVWEQAWHQSYEDDWYTQPTIYVRTGPGNALDGDPKFDLDQFNDVYFDRLRQRVMQARSAGLYVGIPFFDRFSVRYGNTMTDQWSGNPFNANNNINGIDGDPTKQGDGLDTETLILPEVTAYQEEYVKHVIDVLNNLDNVIWEVATEPDGTYTRNGYDAFGWADHMLKYIHSYEATRPYQHPVLYSVFYPGGNNDTLFTSAAEIIAPNGYDGFYHDSPPLDGTKVVLIDTDHIDWTETKDFNWAWKVLTRGAGGFAIMDGGYSEYDDQGGGAQYEDTENFRYNLGWILEYTNRLNLETMTPREDLCSTGYCLANPVANGAEYLIYLPSGRLTTTIMESFGIHKRDHERLSSIYLPFDSVVTVDLSATPGNLVVEWFDPTTGKVSDGDTVKGGHPLDFVAPFPGSAVLYLYQAQ